MSTPEESDDDFEPDDEDDVELDDMDELADEDWKDRKSTRLNSSHSQQSRMPSSA